MNAGFAAIELAQTINDVLQAKRKGDMFWARDSGSSRDHTKAFPCQTDRICSEVGSAQPVTAKTGNTTDNSVTEDYKHKPPKAGHNEDTPSSSRTSRKGWHVFGWRDAMDVVVK